MHLTRESTAGRGREIGYGPPLPFGLLTPAAVQLGLGTVARMAQPDRLEVSAIPMGALQPSSLPRPRLQDPRSLDAGRILDFGAPAPARVVEYAPFAYRPTEAPGHLQRFVTNGRFVEFRR